MKQILISVIITLLISLGVGYVLEDFLGGITKGIVGSIIIQFLFFYFFFQKNKPGDEFSEAELILQDIIETQTCSINCPCGKNTMSVPLFINKDNLFKCDKCNGSFRVDIEYQPIIVTEQLNLNTVFEALKNKELEYNINDEKN